MPRCINVDIIELESLNKRPIQEGCIERTCALAVLSTGYKQTGNIPNSRKSKACTYLVPAKDGALASPLNVQYSLRSYF